MGGTPRIGSAELDLLKFIAERHPVKVRDVVEFAGREKGLARTTVLTMLERLRKKGHLSRRKVEGVFQYEPRASKAEMLRRLVRDFVEGALGGSVAPFAAYLTDAKGFSQKELAELETAVRELKRKNR
jgi:predicted transcriptional regulator